MWDKKQDKVWINYRSDIIAADTTSGSFLAKYLRFTLLNRSHISTLEVIDLQKYKVIKGEKRVRSAIRERLDIPFVFLSCNN